MDKKSYMYIGIGLGVVVVIITIIVIIVNGIGNRKKSYEEALGELKEAAVKYYKKNPELLPVNETGIVTIKSDKLIETDYLKSFIDLIRDGENCTGEVSVTKVGDDYLYIPYLECGDNYTSVRLSDYVTSSDNVVTSGDGLYLDNGEYIFRGEYPNNYIKFDDKLWMIIGVDKEKSLKLVLINEDFDKKAWDDRYNADKNTNVGINNFSVSRIKEYLEKVYSEDKFVSKNKKSYLMKKDWCIGKLSSDDVAISSLNLCGDVYSGYMGTLTATDVLKSSLDSTCVNIYDGQCQNYNYFQEFNAGWTMNAVSDNTYDVYMTNGGGITYSKALSSQNIRPVIYLNPNILYSSGNGTDKDPYIVK